MTAKLNYLWRLIATGCCFATFGLGGLVISAVLIPSVHILPGGRERRKLRIKWLIQKSFVLFISMMQRTGVMRLEIVGGEQLKHSEGMLVLANHPTLVDVVVLLSLIPNANCVVKSALWRNPFLGGVVRGADFISNSAPDTLIDDCALSLSSGQPLVIFPEGTRTKPGQPLKFLRGAAYIALKSGKPVLPVILHCDPPTLNKGAKWYCIPHRTFNFRVEVRPPIQPGMWVDNDAPSAIAARKMTDALENYFKQELETYGNA